MIYIYIYIYVIWKNENMSLFLRTSYGKKSKKKFEN